MSASICQEFSSISILSALCFRNKNEIYFERDTRINTWFYDFIHPNAIVAWNGNLWEKMYTYNFHSKSYNVTTREKNMDMET